MWAGMDSDGGDAACTLPLGHAPLPCTPRHTQGEAGLRTGAEVQKGPEDFGGGATATGPLPGNLQVCLCGNWYEVRGMEGGGRVPQASTVQYTPSRIHRQKAAPDMAR